MTAFTQREREVLEPMAEGGSNAGIVARLVISGGAVGNTWPASSAN